MSGTGETRVLLLSLLTIAPEDAGTEVTCPTGFSSGSSGQPKASFVIPYLCQKQISNYVDYYTSIYC